jgi:hypothetical protein
VTFGGADAFSAVDTIQQFSHFDPATDAITYFVQIQTNGSNSELYVDTTGSGTFGTAHHIAPIQGVTGLTDEDALLTAGTLIAAKPLIPVWVAAR